MDGFGGDRYGQPGKLCNWNRTDLIPIDRASVAEAEL